jgi:acyl carrier protein
MDAISLDTFIQVLGLLINTSGKSAGDEVFVATSIANMTILPCDFKSHRRWAVYAMFSMDGDKRAVGDVFVFSGDRKLVVFGSQISFTKIQSSVLEGLLDGTNSRTNVAKARSSESRIEQSRAPIIAKEEPSATQLPNQRTAVGNSSSKESQRSHHKFDDVKVLIASYVGVSASDIHDDESFSSLGLDSLSAVELVDELRVKFGIDISASDILTAQVAELRNYFLSNERESSATTTSHSTMAGELPTSTNGNVLLTNGLTIEHEDRAENVNGYANGNANDNATEYTNRQLNKALKPRQHIRHRIETVIYKEVDGVEVAADIFIPLEPPSDTMPIGIFNYNVVHNSKCVANFTA